MTGTRLRNLSKPVPLQLYGVDLPWVASATHLGHELHQDCSMDYDSRSKRGRFIENSTAIRETFKFAHPEQILKSIQVHCFDMYGSMLWDVFGQQAAQYYRCWGTCVKLCWDLPRSTHTYFVENLLAKDFQSIRQQVFARYIGFYQSLVKSPSKEVAVISRIVGQDAASTTGNNLLSLRIETGLDAKTAPISKVKEALDVKMTVPEVDCWRLPLVSKYIKIRSELKTACENTDYIDDLLNSLCSS